MKKAAVLLADGFEEVEAITPIDYLRRAGIEVTVAGVTGMEIRGGHGIIVGADIPVDQVVSGDLDAVIIPGGMPGAENVAASRGARSLIEEVFASGKLTAAICAAPAVVLDPLGILKGRKATCYPGFEARFTDAAYLPDRIVKDGNVISSCGPGCAADFSFAIIEYLMGQWPADEVKKRTLNDR
jgi:4-methyl-5(b-hydroxyethyl)-thiazole monophosphate biosynthesis